jgi:hypothetical protein
MEGEPATTELPTSTTNREARLKLRRERRKARKRALLYCRKCDSKENLTKHHIIPVRYRTGRSEKICFCRKCHDKLECHIASIESHYFKIPLGNKKQMPDQEYYTALSTFLGTLRTARFLREVIERNKKRSSKRRRIPKRNKKKKVQNIVHFKPPARQHRLRRRG